MQLFKQRHLRLMRYVSVSKLERLESDTNSLGSTSLSILGFGASFSTHRSEGIQSRVERIEKTLKRQKLIGKISDVGTFQFLEGEVAVCEFVAQGVVIWVGALGTGYIVAGGSATYLDRNIDVFTSKGIIPGSNPSSYYAGLGAIYRQALDSNGNRILIPRSSMQNWPANADGGVYHAENDPYLPHGSSISQINPMDEVIAPNLDFERIFCEANVINVGAGDPKRFKARILLLVHTDHIFEKDISEHSIKAGSRLIVGSPLYVEQLEPSGFHLPVSYDSRKRKFQFRKK